MSQIDNLLTYSSTIGIKKLYYVSGKKYQFSYQFENCIEPEQLTQALKTFPPEQIKLILQSNKSALVLENKKEESAASEHLDIKEIFIQVKVEQTKLAHCFLGKTKSGYYFCVNMFENNSNNYYFGLSQNLNTIFNFFCNQNGLARNESLNAYLKNRLDNSLPVKNNDNKKRLKL